MDEHSVHQIDVMFEPRSVAVIGASDTYEKWGFQVFAAIRESYASRAPVYAVNSGGTYVQGCRAYPRVTDIPGPVDLVAITVPAPHVPSVMTDCVAKGVTAAVVVTGGFAERDEHGRTLQEEMAAIARRGNLRILGPNIMGHLSTASGLITTPFIHSAIKGRIGVASQSGNIGVQILQNACNEGIGFSKYVGTGNEADLCLEDFLEYYAQDAGTDVIAFYIEGLRHGRRFLELARSITREKPVVVFKSGSTDVGGRAARSHSSALAGTDRAYDAAFRQSGVIRAGSVHGLIHTASALCHQPIPRGSSIGIVTIGGGIGVAAADTCRRLGLDVPALSATTLHAIGRLLPPFCSHGNPVDIVGDSHATTGCILALLDDPGIHAVLCVSTPQLRQMLPKRIDAIPPTLKERTVAELTRDIESGLAELDVILAQMRQTGKPVVFCRANPNEDRYSPRFYEKARDKQLLIYPTHDDAAEVLAHLVRYGQYLQSA